MKQILCALAVALMLATTAPCAAQSLIPNCRTSDGSYVRCDPVVLVDKTGTIIDSTNPLPTAPPSGGSSVIPRGGSSILTGQVTVGTSATLIAAARAGRQKIGVTVATAVQCAFGPAGVTLTTGWPLAAVAYAADNWDTTAALYGVCASTATIGFRELY